MNMLFQAETLGSRTQFIEQNGEFPRRQIGDTISGELKLCMLDNGNYRMYIENPKVAAAGDVFGLFRGLLRAGRPGNPIAFEYSTQEMLNKTKQFAYWTATVGCAEMYCIECYDLNTHKGCNYRIMDTKKSLDLAKILGIHKLRYYDEDGNVLKEVGINNVII